MALFWGLFFPALLGLLWVTNINCAKEYLWSKQSDSFRSRQSVGHSTFNKWEKVYDTQRNGQEEEGETFSVCNYDILQGGVSGRTGEAVQNYLVSPQIVVPEEASFVQLNYSMDITKPKSLSSSLKVLKYETSSYGESDIDLIKFEPFDFVNGEYFDMLDGNALLTVPVRQKYVFIALHDTGYCGSISIHSIHTNVCPEQQFGSILMPKTYSQLSKTRISRNLRTISCAANAKVSDLDEQIVKFCRFDGVWEKRTPAERDEEFCICRPGYYGVFQEDGKIICSRCAAGEVKNEAGNSYCRKCPLNSRANRDQTFCECNDKYYKADKTSPYMSCYPAPVLPTDVKTRVTFTNVHISWTEPSTTQPQWYTIKCISCRGQASQQPQVFEALSTVQTSSQEIKNLDPETDYTLLLEVHSAVVEPNGLIAPTMEIKFTTSSKLVVEEPSISVSNNQVHVSWKPPKHLDRHTMAQLRYRVNVMVDHQPVYNGHVLDDTTFSRPLPSIVSRQDMALSIQIAVIINGSEFMGDEMFASTIGLGHLNLLDPGMSRYVMAVGIMLSMLLLVGILVCGVICMVHRTRSMAKFEQHLWNVQGHTPNGYYHHTSSSDHHMGGYDYSTPAVMSSYNLNNLSSVHAFVEPSLYDDIYSVAADFCPTLPSNSVQIGKRINDSSFEGQIFGVMHCQNPTLCAVKLVTGDPSGVLAPNSIEDKKAKRRFLIEAVTMSQFHHCNVQKLHGLIYSAESPYMEMAIELCTSGSLKNYLNEAQLWTSNQHSAVFFLLRGIVHGMEYLHDLGYLHKVLRAQNVMITHNNVAKIAGFEERAFLEENDTATALDELDLVGWQPSEVIKLNKFSPASDVYSFAVLFWEVIHDCRTRPHNMDSSKEIALKTCEGKRPVLPSELPPWVESLISCCWSEDMLSRPSFSTIRQQIDSLIMNNSSVLGGRAQRGSNPIGSQEDILGQQSFYVNPNRINSLQINQFCDFDVTKWLQSLKLEKLAPAFEKRGINSFEQVVMLKETDLASMNDLNSKQRKKLLNSINQFNTKSPISPPVNSSLILADKIESFTEQGV